MLSSSTGLLNHRSRKVIPDTVTLYPKVLQAAGYYTVNTSKKDYNIANYDNATWNDSKLDWERLKEQQPFFQVINSTVSHESKAMSTHYTTHAPANVKLPPYHPDVEGVRANYASYYEASTKMDAKIGHYLAELEASGMAENTVVIHNSDHGAHFHAANATCMTVARIVR